MCVCVSARARAHARVGVFLQGPMLIYVGLDKEKVLDKLKNQHPVKDVAEVLADELKLRERLIPL